MVLEIIGTVGGVLTVIGGGTVVVAKLGMWRGKVDERIASKPPSATDAPVTLENIRTEIREHRATTQSLVTTVHGIDRRVAFIEGRIKGRADAIDEFDVREPTGQHRVPR